MRKLLWAAGALVVVWFLIALFPLVFPNAGRNQGLAAGEERVPDGETEAVNRSVDGIVKVMEPIWAHDSIARRDAHAKAHGCVKAKFAVADGLPPELAVGLFAAPKSWDATVRFSSSERIPQSDQKRDGRGMAVKLDGVEQDFVMINHPVFFVRNAADYVDFVEGEQRNDHYSFFFGLRWPWRWRLHELWNGIHIKGHPLRSPLEERYFSMTPYKLGTRAIKFSARPCSNQLTPVPSTGDNVLAAMLVNQLRSGEGCFDFQVQLQGDPHAMPVEDPTIEWDEAKSPFRTVARITIPSQTPETANCENLAFAPWHAQPEHQPLGGINRVRKEAYQRISTLRHQRNHVPN